MKFTEYIKKITNKYFKCKNHSAKQIPLTLQELYDNVSGNNPYPIWVVFTKGVESCYPAILDLRYEIIAIIGSDEKTCYLHEKDYGTKWIAYRNNPQNTVNVETYENVLCNDVVKRGSWKTIVYHNGCTPDYDCVCSICGESGVPSYNYCPNCGAKMDLE